MFFLPAHGRNSLSFQGTKDAPSVRPNKREREKENSAVEGEPKCKKVKLADRQQMPDSTKKSKEDRLEEFTRVMSKKCVDKADWSAEVGVEVENSNLTRRHNDEGEAKEKNPSRGTGADSDGSSTQGNVEEIISDAEWMRRKMGGVELDKKVFEQSDDDDELNKPETIQVCFYCLFQYNYFILKPS